MKNDDRVFTRVGDEGWVPGRISDLREFTAQVRFSDGWVVTRRREEIITPEQHEALVANKVLLT